MSQKELVDIVAQAIQNVTGRPSAGLGPETALRDYGVSSIDLLRFVKNLEELLGREIPDEYLSPASFTTVGSTIDVLSSVVGLSSSDD